MKCPETADHYNEPATRCGRGQKVLNKREKIKIQTMTLRKQMHYRNPLQHNLMS
jgi:hypothetical protein